MKRINRLLRKLIRYIKKNPVQAWLLFNSLGLAGYSAGNYFDNATLQLAAGALFMLAIGTLTMRIMRLFK